jgi:hypothetical protein
MYAQMLIPFLLVAVGIWRWRELSKGGEFGFLLGIVVFFLCVIAAVCFALGVIACGLHC